jgi:PAS domain S-box-containing protein
LDNSNFRELVETLTRENEEKTYQMSIVRLVAEATVRNLNEPDYFAQVCSSFANIFKASLCAFYWLRHREPTGWALDSWANRCGNFSPATELITHSEAGLLQWVEAHAKPFYMEEVVDEAILDIWDTEAFQHPGVAFLPVKCDNNHMGAFTIIDPVIRLPLKKTNRLLETIDGLILAGTRNRLLYTRLENSEEEFRDLIENSSDMVVVVFPEGIIKDCNRTFYEKLRIKSEPRGNKISDFILEQNGGVFQNILEKLTTDHVIDNVDVIVKTLDDLLLEMEVSGNTRLNRDGSISVIRLYMHDVTEKRRSEREKRELEMRMKVMRQQELAQLGLYVSGIVHNLQNPVHVVLGHLEIMKLKGYDYPGLEAIEKSTRNITDIINNLLDKVRRERNTEKTKINLNELLQCELTFLNANAYFKNQVQKSYEFDGNLPEIEGVYVDFSQAIMNLVYNALDAMKDKEHRQLKIGTEYRAERREIVITVSDTGGGIPDEISEKIYTPFFTTKTSREAGSGELISGSGLGLSSALALLDPYQGKIHFESLPGEGTTFYVTIPIKPDGDEA